MLPPSLSWGLLPADGADFNADLISKDFLDGDSLTEPFERIPALQLLKLDWSVLVEELVN